MVDWLALFDIAVEIIAHAEKNMGGKISWSIGGGTILDYPCSHRYSNDIDIFIGDPQILLFLTPRTNAVAERVGNAAVG